MVLGLKPCFGIDKMIRDKFSEERGKLILG